VRGAWPRAYAAGLPPRSWRHSHQVHGVDEPIDCQGRPCCFNAQALAAPELLTALLVAPGPSGHEEAPARIWRDAASAFADVTSDTLGTSFARVRSAEGAPSFAVVGHIDEIGVAVTNVEDNGLLSFTTIGGIAAETLVGQRVELQTAAGVVPGAIGRRRIPPEQVRDRPRPELSDLHIDIGARDRGDAERLVRVGDAGVWSGVPVELPNGRLMSRALDNRLGAFVALEIARRVAEAGADVDLVAVAAVQEEIGPYGARAAAFGLDPHVALVIDVTPATDVPGGDARRAGRVELGAGAMIARGPTLNKKVTELLADAAQDDGIPHAFEVYSRLTQTDADEIHLARSGVPTGLVSIPTRYLHTPGEICDLADVEAVVRLGTALARRLDRDGSFVR
jgi:putative aminopeptidase FrvX